jgi:cysteine desulfurase
MTLIRAVKDQRVERIISSPLEHHCVLHTLEELGKMGVKVEHVNLQENGHIQYEHLEELLKEDAGKTMVSLMMANNEIGNMLNVDRVAKMCKEHGALFHSDTVQAIGHFPIDVQETPFDFITGSAHKFHGPKGVGFLYINSDSMVKPYIHGGAQERNMRAGTENLYGIVGLGKAIELAHDHMNAHREHIEGLREYMKEQLAKHIPGVTFNGDHEEYYLYTVLNASFPPSKKGSMMLFNLDIAGIAASGGSACSSGSDIGSHVLGALNVPEDRTNVRFSFSRHNTKEEVDYVVEKVKELTEEKEKV